MFQILTEEEMAHDYKKVARCNNDALNKFSKIPRPEITIPEPDIVHGNKCYTKYTVNDIYKSVKEKYKLSINYKSFLKLFPEHKNAYESVSGRSRIWIYTISQVEKIKEDLQDLIKYRYIRSPRKRPETLFENSEENI